MRGVRFNGTTNQHVAIGFCKLSAIELVPGDMIYSFSGTSAHTRRPMHFSLVISVEFSTISALKLAPVEVIKLYILSLTEGLRELTLEKNETVFCFACGEA